MIHKGYRKKGTAKPEKYGIVFDSIDEVWMYEWLLDAKKVGLVKDFLYHPECVEVFPAYVEGKKTVFHSCTYTPDFIITGIHDKLKPYFRKSEDSFYWIDIKGSFSAHSDLRSFMLICKALWYLKKIYVNKTVMKDLCSKTFVPESIKYTDKKKQLRTAFKDCRTLEEFLKDK